MKDSPTSKLRFRWPAILRRPFSRRGEKQRTNAYGGEDALNPTSSYETDVTQRRRSSIDNAHIPTDTSASSTRDPSTSIDVNIQQRTTSASVLVVGHLVSVDGRAQSPAPSQAHTTKSHRRSMSKTTSGDNVRVSLTVDTIKQQLSDGLQVLAEFKKSLRASSDEQRYNEAVGNFEGAAKDLALLKSKLSTTGRGKLGGGGGNVSGNRNSWILPPPDLTLEIEDVPFSIGIPGIEETKQETLEVVQENREKEAHEEGVRV